MTYFALAGKSGSFSQLIPEKKTQVVKMFSGMRRPRKHRQMMFKLTAVLAVCRSPGVLSMTMELEQDGTILGA